MRRRDFLFAASLNIALTRAQQRNLAGTRGVHIGFRENRPSPAEFRSAGIEEVFDRPSKAVLPFVSPSNLRRNRFRGGPYSARPIEADCFRCAAYGAGCEIELDGPDLGPIGGIFRRLALLDPWTHDATPIVDVGLLGDSPLSRTLLDLHEQFDIIETDADYSAFRLLIVPNPNKADPRKLQAYRKFGGSVYTPPLNVTRDALTVALRAYVPKPAVIAPGLPPEAEVTFLEQRLPGGIRRVGHVLYYPDNKPGTLENVTLSFWLPQHPLNVITIPDQRPIEFVHNEFLTTFTLARLTGHQGIAFE